MNSEAILDLIRIVVLTFILAGCIRLIFRRKNMAFVVFFTLGMACILLSDFYWLAYDVLRPDSRMPFAANEICEWSLFLLLGSALFSGCPREYLRWKAEIFTVVVFVGCNVVLWIGWSGEWVQDILTGAALSYFLCALVCRIKRESILKRVSEIHLYSAGFLLILGQTGTFYLPAIKGILDLACYILMFTVLAVLIIVTVLSFWKNNPSKTVCLSLISFAWCVITLYMSSGGFYFAASVLSAVCFLLMYAALKKEVTAE